MLGTRPEAIKLAPVVRALESQPDFITRICVTGQHLDLVEQALGVFGLRPHHDLRVMRARQSLSAVAARVLHRLPPVIRRERPDWVLVQGDTTSALAGALTAMHARVPVGHVEAGLRSGTVDQPWPEELNRQRVANERGANSSTEQGARHDCEELDGPRWWGALI